MGVYLLQCTSSLSTSVSDSKLEEIGFDSQNRHNSLYYPGKNIKSQMSILDYQIHSCDGITLEKPLPELPLKIRIYPAFNIAENTIYIRGDNNYAERIIMDDYMQLKESLCETHYGTGHFCTGGHGDPEIMRLVNELGKKHNLVFPINSPVSKFNPGKNWFDFLIEISEKYQRFGIALINKAERAEIGNLTPKDLPSLDYLYNTVSTMKWEAIKKNTWRVASNQRSPQ